MSSQEMKKKEKGKEIVTSEETPTTSFHHLNHFHHKDMLLSEEEIEALLQSNKVTYKENLEKSKKDNAEKVGIDDQKGKSSSSSSKITPCIFYTSDEKARLRWSSDLHDCFVNAVDKLGGPNKATPKSVKEMMEVEGIALHHVKSHLQKFRLGKCNIRDGTNQYLRRFRNAREVKTCASINSRPQVNIKPRFLGAVKPKQKKEKEVQGSLYMLIENDLRLQRCREAQRMQNAFAIENQTNMFETQYFKASMVPTLHSDQHNNYTSILQQPSSHIQEQWLIPLSYHFPEGETNPSIMNYPQQPSIINPQNFTSVDDFCNDGMACLSLSDFTQNTNTFSMYEPSIYPSHQGDLEFNDHHSYNMAQGFINPYMTMESQSMLGLSTITPQQQLQRNDDCLIHDSYGNATFLSATVPSTIDSLHQGTLNNNVPFSTTPQSIAASVPHHTYMSSYPPYNTLEVVKAQLNALQNSSINQTQETLSGETNVLSSVTRDEVDPVDKYIDWAKVEERDFELDPVEVLQALGFGVSP